MFCKTGEVSVVLARCYFGYNIPASHQHVGIVTVSMLALAQSTTAPPAWLQTGLNCLKLTVSVKIHLIKWIETTIFFVITDIAHETLSLLVISMGRTNNKTCLQNRQAEKKPNTVIDHDVVVLHVTLVHSSIFPLDIKQKRDLFFFKYIDVSDVH